MLEKWIKVPKELDSCFIKKIIEVNTFDDAYIYITGLGFYELFINGNRVDTTFYKPTVTDYLPRNLVKLKDNIDEKTSNKICFNEFNIREFLKNGLNEIKILLGNGFYRQIKRLPGGDDFHFGDNLMASFEIHILNNKDEIIFIPDGNEIVTKSFITFNNIFYGEHHDYDNLKDNTTFKYDITEMDVNLVNETSARDIVSRTIKPKLIYKGDNKCIYDLGENVSAILCIKEFNGDVEISFSEEINGDFSLNFDSAGDPYNEGLQIHRNIYKNVKENMTCFPYFSFTCFRYFESDKLLKNVTAEVIHSNVKEIGYVKTNNELVNWYYEAFKRTMLNNMHYSYPSDCPHRERLGYLGDGQITSLITMMMFDARDFYRKWIDDIIACQDIKSGHIQHTAPFFGGGGGPSIWGGAIIIVPYNFYLVYKDLDILEHSFIYMEKYIECMKTFIDDYLIVKERRWGWALGDWCGSVPIKVSEAFVNSAYFVYLLEKFKIICHLLNKKYKYTGLVNSIKLSIDKHFLNRTTMNYCDNVNSANAFALLIGLGNEMTLENLKNKFKDDIHLNTGFAGTSVLSEVLAKEDPKLLFDIFNCDTYPSFGYIKNTFKATTWYEGFAFDGSHCHHMQAGFLSYFLNALLHEDENKKTMLKDASIRYIFDGKINSFKIKDYRKIKIS